MSFKSPPLLSEKGWENGVWQEFFNRSVVVIHETLKTGPEFHNPKTSDDRTTLFRQRINKPPGPENLK
jgi:hypothetical protein